MTLGYQTNNETFQNAPFIPLSDCTEKYPDKNQFWNSHPNFHPRWLSCGFMYEPASKHIPRKLMWRSGTFPSRQGSMTTLHTLKD